MKREEKRRKKKDEEEGGILVLFSFFLCLLRVNTNTEEFDRERLPGKFPIVNVSKLPYLDYVSVPSFTAQF